MRAVIRLHREASFHCLVTGEQYRQGDYNNRRNDDARVTPQVAPEARRRTSRAFAIRRTITLRRSDDATPIRIRPGVLRRTIRLRGRSDRDLNLLWFTCSKSSW